VPATSSAQPEPECFCGTLGAIGQRGVPVQADLFGESSLRTALTQFKSITSANAITRGRATFCYFLVPTNCRRPWTIHRMSRAPRRFS